VRGDIEPPVTGHDARRALEISLAAMRSHQEQRPIRIG
jgi:myo-inositol 2-dehydrogenase/D-chiro-inositol 1-dehydrogenase